MIQYMRNTKINYSFFYKHNKFSYSYMKSHVNFITINFHIRIQKIKIYKKSDFFF